MNGGPVDHNDPATAKKQVWLWLQLVAICWGVAAIVWFGWWDAQVNDLKGGPVGGSRAGAPFPWLIVAPGSVGGAFAAMKAGGAWIRYRRLRKKQGAR